MLSNANLLRAYATHKAAKIDRVVSTLRSRNPKLEGWSTEEILTLYNDSVSLHQSKDGKFFEREIENQLQEAGIPFKAQVSINSEGIVVKGSKRGRGITIPDIVFGNPVVGTHISNYVVMSLKTSSRERAKLDTAWTFKTPPRAFYYGTLTNDYPDPVAFGETPTRKLVCATPRENDSRGFKLRFDDLIEEVRGLLPE